MAIILGVPIFRTFTIVHVLNNEQESSEDNGAGHMGA